MDLEIAPFLQMYPFAFSRENILDWWAQTEKENPLFLNIVTGKLMPDEGKIEWAKNVRVGYLDQHTVLEKGMTIRDVLKSAFSYLFELEERMNASAILWERPLRKKWIQ